MCFQEQNYKHSQTHHFKELCHFHLQYATPYLILISNIRISSHENNSIFPCFCHGQAFVEKHNSMQVS